MSDPRTSWPSARAEGYRTTRMLFGAMLLLLVLVAIGIATVSWAGAAHGADKVTICHHDNGKPGWKQIDVSTDALSAHLAHQWGADLYPVPEGGCPGAVSPEPSWTPTPTPPAFSPDPSPTTSSEPTSEPSAPATPSGSQASPSSSPTSSPTTSPTPTTSASPSTSPSPESTTTSPTVSTATSTPSASATPVSVVLDAADTPAELAETGMDLGAPTWIALGLIAAGGLAIFAAAEHQVKRGRL